MTVVLAKARMAALFNPKAEGLAIEDYKEGDKLIPYKVIAEFKGSELAGVEYNQLMPWVRPDGDAFKVITGDFVTTEDGTGIVHIAPTFGADDDRVAKAAGIAPLMMLDKDGNQRPMVDMSGRFFRLEDLDYKFVEDHVNVDLYREYAGRYVKNAFDSTLTEADSTLDVDLCVMLKINNQAFKIEKHTHSYPHC